MKNGCLIFVVIIILAFLYFLTKNISIAPVLPVPPIPPIPDIVVPLPEPLPIPIIKTEEEIVSIEDKVVDETIVDPNPNSDLPEPTPIPSDDYLPEPAPIPVVKPDEDSPTRPIIRGRWEIRTRRTGLLGLRLEKYKVWVND